MAHSEKQWGQTSAERGNELRASPTAKVARHRRREHHDQPDRQRGEDSEADERVAEQLVGNTSNRRCERRLVHVPPGKLLPALEEVQLIAVPSVTSGDR